MINDFAKTWAKQLAEFEQQLLLSLLPHTTANALDDTEAREFIKTNNIHFVVFPDERKELHGFGKKLGDVFYGVESHSPEKGLYLVAQFTPVASCVTASELHDKSDNLIVIDEYHVLQESDFHDLEQLIDQFSPHASSTIKRDWDRFQNGWATGSMKCDQCGNTFQNVRFRYSCHDKVEGHWPTCCGQLTSFCLDWEPEHGPSGNGPPDK